MFRKERLRGRHLAALPCRGMSITLSPMSQRGVIIPRPFNVSRYLTSPGPNTDLLKVPNVDTWPASKDRLKYRGKSGVRDYLFISLFLVRRPRPTRRHSDAAKPPGIHAWISQSRADSLINHHQGMDSRCANAQVGMTDLGVGLRDISLIASRITQRISILIYNFM